MSWLRYRPLRGEVRAPPSKSLSIRALAAAALVRGRTRLIGVSDCADAWAARRAAQALGARIRPLAGGLEIYGGAGRIEPRLDCGESGLCLRLFAALAALGDRTLELRARGSLAGRPVDMVAAPLRALGAACRSSAGLAPLRVRGPLAGGRARVDGAQSSQFLSGLLLACPLAPGPTELEVVDLHSKPYVRLTLELLRAFGIDWEAAGDLSWLRHPGGQAFGTDVELAIEGDWSGAAGLLAAGALAGPLRVSGLRLDSAQADRAVLDALRAAGAQVVEEQAAVTVAPGRPRPFAFDATDCPDLIPVLAALATALPGESLLAGAGRLHRKECDRAAALVAELGRLGARVRLDGDRLRVAPGRWRAAEVDPRGDHRMVMAAAVAALAGRGRVDIADAGCVAKSYPAFLDDLRALGAVVG